MLSFTEMLSFVEKYISLFPSSVFSLKALWIRMKLSNHPAEQSIESFRVVPEVPVVRHWRSVRLQYVR